MTVSPRLDNMRVIRAPRGPNVSAKSWLTEAPLRMLMNNLDPEVAERPDELVVYGGIGRAARDWDCFDRIVATLRRLEDDETLLVQSGKPVGVFRTHADAPRVLIANSNLVPHWATWEHFHELDRKGLMMYGQMTAGSWIYIGCQGIVQGTYETFVEMGRQHYGGDLAGRWILTGGPRRHGRRAAAGGDAWPAPRCSPSNASQSRIEMRLRTGYLDVAGAATSTTRSRCIEKATRERQGRLGRPARQRRRDVCPSSCAAACGPTSSPTRPRRTIRSTATCRRAGRWREWDERARARSRRRVERAAQALDGRARARDARLPQRRRPDRRLRQQHPPDGAGRGRRRRLRLSRASCRPTSARCSAAASARSAGSRCPAIPRTSIKTDAKVKELLPDDAHLHHWLDMARERITFQGLPARICWVGLGDRAPARPRLQRDGGEAAS